MGTALRGDRPGPCRMFASIPGLHSVYPPSCDNQAIPSESPRAPAGQEVEAQGGSSARPRRGCSRSGRTESARPSMHPDPQAGAGSPGGFRPLRPPPAAAHLSFSVFGLGLKTPSRRPPGEFRQHCRIFRASSRPQILIIPFIFQCSQDKGNKHLEEDTSCVCSFAGCDVMGSCLGRSQRGPCAGPSRGRAVGIPGMLTESKMSPKC